MLMYFLSRQGFPGLLSSSLQHNQFPSTVASQTSVGYNNSRADTQSEYEINLIF